MRWRGLPGPRWRRFRCAGCAGPERREPSRPARPGRARGRSSRLPGRPAGPGCRRPGGVVAGREEAAAGLLAGLERDGGPAHEAFASGEVEPLLTARGLEGNDGRDAQFGGFLDDPFKTFELDQGGQQGQSHVRRLRGERLEDTEGDPVLAEGLDLGQVEGLVVGDLEALTGLGAEHAGQVAGLDALQGRPPLTELLGNASVSGGPGWDKLQLVSRCRRKWARQAKAYPTRGPIPPGD